MESYDSIPESLMQKIRVMSGCNDVRDIPDWPLYAVTIDGQIWSVKPHGRSVRLPKVPRRMKTKIWKGYEVLNLSDNAVLKTFSVAKLLLITFISPPPSEHAWASFKDGNPLNLKLDNLVWSDSPDAHKRGVERHGGAFTYGEALNHTKLTPAIVEQMRQDNEQGMTQQAIATKYGVTRRTAARAIRGEYWKQVNAPPSSATNYKKGEGVSLAKLNPDKVRQIREKIQAGQSLSSISREYGVGTTVVWSIKKGLTWKHVE